MAITLYSGYDLTDLAVPPLTVYEENFKRVILLSDDAYTEMSAELGVTIPIIPSTSIVYGDLPSSQEPTAIAIAARQGTESDSPSALTTEVINFDFAIRTGQDGSPTTQRKRASGLNEIIRRILRKILMLDIKYILTDGWPANEDKRYDAPEMQVVSMTQFPIGSKQDQAIGYTSGIRLSMRMTYYPVKDKM